jgi:uncharacterized membrane protein YjjB (DUF3815 family)
LVSVILAIRIWINHNRKKQLEKREAYMRFSYEADFWRNYVNSEKRSSVWIIVLGAAVGTVVTVITLGDYPSYILAIGTGLAVMLLIWGIALLRRVIVNRNPGEVYIVPGGAYYRGSAICWNARSAPYDITYVERKPEITLITIHYRKGKSDGNMKPMELEIPVPPLLASDAEAVALKLNANPY